MKTYPLLKQNRFLALLRTTFCALTIIAVPLTLPSSAADRARRAADTPEPASGEFFPCFTYAGPPRQVGENWIITFNVITTATGSINGFLVGTELDIVHSDGSINLHGTGLFTGTVNGRSGTLLVTYNGTAASGHETLRVVGGHGTGDLAGVHYNGTAEGDAVPPEPGCDASGEGTYTGQLVFAP